jgi:hypothetical protein
LEKERGGGSPLASRHLTSELRKKGRRSAPQLSHVAASHHLKCHHCMLLAPTSRVIPAIGKEKREGREGEE